MLNNKKSVGTRLAKTGIIASIYIVATMCLPFASYGSIQLRFSEALTILPLFMPESIVGLFIGCLIANIIGNGVLDVVFGSLATLIAGILTYFIGKLIKNEAVRFIVGGLPPVIVNAFIIPFTFLAITELESLYWLNVLTIFIGQFLAVYVFGTLLYLAIKKFYKKSKN
jgi:uncharacterized membrane protein